MATIKSYSDLEQSRKLAEFLPLESADMHYCLEQRDVATEYEIGITPFIKAKRFEGKCNIVDVQPAWSLAALLSVLPKIVNNETLFIGTSAVLWHVGYMNIYFARTDNLIDACYEMILKLHELKML